MSAVPDFSPAIDVQHPPDGRLERECVAGLLANRLDPKLLYASPRQAELWRRVHENHSPLQRNPEFARIYQDAFAAISRETTGDLMLVGLGAGAGRKERDLYLALRANGSVPPFRAADISRDLVAETLRRLHDAGCAVQRGLVGDLADAASIRQWLDEADSRPRLFTFFGVVPNFMPAQIAPLFRALLRSGDRLLVSAHLAPVDADTGLAAAMRRVLPQYDNPATLAWLAGALEACHLADRFEAPQMQIAEIEGVPAFVAVARWKTPFVEVGGTRIEPPATGAPLRLFHSLRYTPRLFEQTLREAGLHPRLLAQTRCGEEAVWAVTLP